MCSGGLIRRGSPNKILLPPQQNLGPALGLSVPLLSVGRLRSWMNHSLASQRGLWSILRGSSSANVSCRAAWSCLLCANNIPELSRNLTVWQLSVQRTILPCCTQLTVHLYTMGNLHPKLASTMLRVLVMRYVNAIAIFFYLSQHSYGVALRAAHTYPSHRL